MLGGATTSTPSARISNRSVSTAIVFVFVGSVIER
jgi:hypothetical protein